MARESYINKYTYRNLLKLSPGGETVVEYVNKSIVYINMVRLDNDRAIFRLNNNGRVIYAVYLDTLNIKAANKALVTLRKQGRKVQP